MYSLVLMTAMTGAPNGPEFNGYFRDLLFGCGGCNCNGSSSAAPAGCTGAYAPRYSCYGGGCNGSSYTYGCNGCNGNSFLNRVRHWFDPPAGCCGGSGSGYNYGCCGGSGYSYGCSGSSYSCFGSSSMCYGGSAPIPTPIYDPYPSYPSLPGVAPPPPSIPYAPPEVAPGPTGLNTGVRPAGHNTAALASNGPTGRATVLVKLPADARLYADSKALNLTGTERKFVSPELPAGQEFVYRFRAEYERGGETLSVTKKVPVKAGATLTIEFTDLTAAKAAPEQNADKKNDKGNTVIAATPTSNSGAGNAIIPSVTPPVAPPVVAPPAAGPTERATIAVKLPPGATLFVDGQKSSSNEPFRQFTTPALPTGREFAYLLRAEVVRNGQTETFTQKVPFRAGERVEVDFTGR
jgi:uncharacterized protein (TIGR03000 family)